jgi:hypothetical protein
LVLDVSNNSLTQGKLLQKKTYGPDGDTDDEEEHELDFLGVVALANGIKDMRALTSLNLSDNDLTGYYVVLTSRGGSPDMSGVLPCQEISIITCINMSLLLLARCYHPCWCNQGYGGVDVT